MAGRAIAVLVNDRCAPFYLIFNLFRFACFVNSSLRFLIPNLHPICTCSCLFTPLTEGRSARDLTQAATSQKKAPFYLISIYLHPDFVSRELEQIIHAWRNTEKKSGKIVMGGTSTKQM